MSDIKVNKLIWDAISEQDKQHIITHLRQFGVLKPEQQIVADARTMFPAIRSHVNDTTVDAKKVKAIGLDWTCRAICDSTNAETNCIFYGQPLSACLCAISRSREFLGADFEKV